jgi:hypothetical protein
VLALLAGLMLLGFWTYSAVERSLLELRAATLTSMLEAQVRTLGIWSETHQVGDGRFAALLSAVRTGDTGEAYAFDRQGALVSQGRSAPGAPPRRAPRAAEAPQGAALEPYRSYHGREVIGVWRWLPQYDLGIAVEIGAEEAYAPLRHLNVAFGIVFGTLILALFVALGGAVALARLRQGGRKVGAYRLGRQIGEGGAAYVYLARHDLLKRPTAIKLLKLARTTESSSATARFRWRARSTSCARSAKRWSRRTARASCTATSSPRTSWSAATAASTTSSRSSTSGW